MTPKIAEPRVVSVRNSSVCVRRRTAYITAMPSAAAPATISPIKSRFMAWRV